MKKTIILIFTVCLFLNSAFSQQWILMGEDTLCAGSSVRSMFAKNDTVYVGGEFYYYGPSCDPLRTIGYYVNGSWHSMNLGLYNSQGPRTMMFYKGHLYVGGYNICVMTGITYPTPGYCLPNTDNALRWNFMLQDFQAIPNSYGQIEDIVRDMTIYKDTLIFCGSFRSIGPYPPYALNFMQVAAYDGTDFINIGALPNTALCIEVFNDEIYAGGNWGNIKKYVGGSGAQNYNAWQDAVFADGILFFDMGVDTFNNFLYIAGEVNNVMDPNTDIIETTDGIIKYDGFKWEGVGFGCAPGGARAVGIYRNELYTSFYYDTICGIQVNCVAKWDDINNTWQGLGKGTTSAPIVMLEVNDTLWVGGGFSYVDSIKNNALARWYEPKNGCNYIKPRVQCMADTFYLNTTQPTATVEFFNNNAYADDWYWDFDDGHTLWSVKDPVHEFTSAGTYNVSVTVYHDTCIKTATRTITVIDNTGTEEYTKESLQFKIYPNPTDGGITVECTLPPAQTGTLRTHHSNGGLKTSHQLQPGQNTILIPSGDLSPGISFVSLYIENRFVFSEKVIKTR
jgi:PKD repeat protein